MKEKKGFELSYALGKLFSVSLSFPDDHSIL